MTDEPAGAIPFCLQHSTAWQTGCEGCEAAQPVAAMAASHRARYPRCRDWPLCDCGSKPTWYSDDYRRQYEALAASLTFRRSEMHDGFLVDLWMGPKGLVTVVTILPGVTYAQVQGALPEWSALAYAEPDPDPQARLMEGLLQGHLRAYDRLTS